MRRADRDGERVDAGRGDVRGGLVRIGAGPGRVDAVLAADLAELGLDPCAALVADGLVPIASCRQAGLDGILVGVDEGAFSDVSVIDQRREIDQVQGDHSAKAFPGGIDPTCRLCLSLARRAPPWIPMGASRFLFLGRLK